MSAIAVIPARFQSSRFPGKILAAKTGRPLIQHVYQQVLKAKKIASALIATDDSRIADAVRGFGGEVVLTRANHPNGTSRIAQVAPDLRHDIVVNVQGDEPEIDPHVIDLAIDTILLHRECPIATVASPFTDDEDPANPNIVKVALDVRSRALYFSRALIPFNRQLHLDQPNPSPLSSSAIFISHPAATSTASHSVERASPAHTAQPHVAPPLKHVGLYVYRRDFLLHYPSLVPTPLEQTEQLEQLRFLEHGYPIAVAVHPTHHHGIDTPEQYDAFVRRHLAHSTSQPC